MYNRNQAKKETVKEITRELSGDMGMSVADYEDYLLGCEYEADWHDLESQSY